MELGYFGVQVSTSDAAAELIRFQLITFLSQSLYLINEIFGSSIFSK